MFLIFQFEDILQSNQLGWFLVILLSVVLALVIVILVYILYSKGRQIEYLKSLIPLQKQQKLDKTQIEKGGFLL